jgi:hypothetical protein
MWKEKAEGWREGEQKIVEDKMKEKRVTKVKGEGEDNS